MEFSKFIPEIEKDTAYSPEEPNDGTFSRPSLLFSGYIVNNLNEPLESVLIENKNTLKKTYSNEDGYFQIPLSLGDQLLFEKENYRNLERFIYNTDVNIFILLPFEKNISNIYLVFYLFILLLFLILISLFSKYVNKYGNTMRMDICFGFWIISFLHSFLAVFFIQYGSYLA